MSGTDDRRPNFLLIVADDLGYSDLSCFGSEIPTPNIDSVAKDGSLLSDFYTAAACSPTRSMLLTGTDNHIAGLGQMHEFIRRNRKYQGRPGHEGYLNDSVVTLQEILSESGYETMISGKWHLGLTPDTAPSARGFQRSFSLLPGCANHYGYEPQLEEGENIPAFIETTVVALHEEDGKYVKKLPEGFYSTDAYTDKMLHYLTTRDRKKPFFAYLPYAAPHWPMQAHKADRETFRGLYDEGPDALRLRRLEGLRKCGIIDEDCTVWPVHIPEQKKWEDLTDLERRKSARAMETFAGMVLAMDRGIGRVLEQLKQDGDYENTIIVFMSDNGAEGTSMEAIPVVGPSIAAHIEKYYDNSLENIGEEDSYTWYGGRWATAATAPSKLWKMMPTQGGIKVPAIISGPGIPKGVIDDCFMTVMDILPSFLELAQTPHQTTWKGRSVAPVRGETLIPHFKKSAPVHAADYVMGWELTGQAAIRKGNLKIVWLASPRGENRWELFDVKKDPGETNDLSRSHPDVLKEMLKHWEEYKRETGTVGLRTDVVDEMKDDTLWMKFEKSTSWRIARQEGVH
jgi:arylsulfatase A-like enzyme